MTYDDRRKYRCGYCGHGARMEDASEPYRHIFSRHPAVWAAQPLIRSAGKALGVK